MQNIDSDLIRGNIDTIILKTMVDGDKYGLDIIKEVEIRSNGTYELKQPTLYSCLKRLENQELISSYWLDSDIGGKRHYYKLTDKGKETLQKKQEEWSKSKFIIDNLLSNFNYDEYRLVKKDDYDRIIEGKQFEYVPQESDNQQPKPTEDVEEDTSLSSVETDKTFEEPLTDTQESEIESDEDEELIEDNIPQNEVVYYADNSFQEPKDVSQLSIAETVDADDEDDLNTEKENNILEKLRSWNNEEINEYVGDKNSYINFVNTNAVQQNILDNETLEENSLVDEKIEEFSTAVDELNNFTSDGDPVEEENDNQEIDDTYPPPEEYAEENVIEEQSISNYAQENSPYKDFSHDENDDFLSELEELNDSNHGTFFGSTDNVDYQETEQKENNLINSPIQISEEITPVENDLSNYTDDSYPPFNDDNESDYNTESLTEQSTEETIESDSNEDNTPLETNYDYSDFDSIISRNATEYKVENTTYEDSNYEPFKPSYTSENYKQKLSNLSVYSKVSIDEDDSKAETNNDAIEKTKDINSLKAEFEKEGIKVKEFRRAGQEEIEKNYLLVNKINLIRSLILFFGYVFILSALYIILNNTSLRDMQGFSIKYFLYGFIPFGIYVLYYIILFLINPYKKVPAKYAPRIMIFISVIITVQLLLITYCVNLQLGFYSFTQSFYNHLIWIIPSIISFAPIISNLIFVTLFYSKNFNV